MATQILNEKQFAALGEVAAESAELESTIGLMIMLVLKFTDADRDAIITPMNISIRLEVLKKVGLPRIRSKKRKKEFLDLSDRLKDLLGKRNIAIHGCWTPVGDLKLGELMAIMAGLSKPAAVEAKNKKGVFKAERLAQLAKELREGRSQLWAIAKATWIKFGVKVEIPKD